MSDAFKLHNSDLPACRARRPHLRDHDEAGARTSRTSRSGYGRSSGCVERLVPGHAVGPGGPPSSNLLKQLVNDHWSDLYDLESEADIAKMRRRNLLRDFAGVSDAEIWEAIQEKQAEGETATGSDVDDLKTPEWEVFIDPAHAQKTRDFQLRRCVPPAATPSISRRSSWRNGCGKCGRSSASPASSPQATTTTPPSSQKPSGEDRPCNPSWVPSNEIRGEGLFFQFTETEIQNWLGRVSGSTSSSSTPTSSGGSTEGLQPPEDFYPGLRYVLLHSFAHALIRQLSLECGYTAASLRERIYSRNPGTDRPEMAGVLIYTAAPDSEGTLGGLVSLGEPDILERHLDQAMDSMRLCSSDPLCSEHHPGKEGTSLHGASCHACLFAPETSCERGNKYLDRTVLVPTVDRDEFAFFHDLESDASVSSGC